MILLMFFVMFQVAFPINALYFQSEANGEALTSRTTNNSVKLEGDNWYNFTDELYDFDADGKDKSFLSKLFSFFNGDKEAKKTETESQLTEDELPSASDDIFDAYTDSTNALMKIIKKAFSKGWKTTLETAKYRADMITVDGDKNVVDTFDDTTMWKADEDGEEYWNNWTAGENQYRAGTFDYSGGTYQAVDSAGNVTSIPSAEDSIQVQTTDSVADESNKTYFIDLILKVVALQNCAEQAVIENDDGTKDLGIKTQYDDDTVSSGQMEITEYQLLRFAGEVGGKGITKSSLDAMSKEAEEEGSTGTTVSSDDCIYQIVTSTSITPTLNSVQIQKQVGTGEYEDELDADGNPMLDENGNVKQKEKMEWVDDHEDCYVTYTVCTSYHIELKNNVKQTFINAITKDYSDKEKTAYNEAVDGYYDVQYEMLCTLYGQPMIDDSGNYIYGSGGGVGSSLTEEERAALLESLANLDGLSSRQASIGALLTRLLNGESCGVRVVDQGCQTFVADLYHVAGQSVRMSQNTATAAGNAWIVDTSSSNIPNGAVVYAYSRYSSAGHVGIYWDGKVIDSVLGSVHSQTFEEWCNSGYSYRGWGMNGWDISQ